MRHIQREDKDTREESPPTFEHICLYVLVCLNTIKGTPNNKKISITMKNDIPYGLNFS